MKHYVISGGAGFLGSHLTKRLLLEGNKVTVIDNYYTGRKENFLGIDTDNLIMVNHDICETFDIDGDVDYVCNLACPASPIHYFKAAAETLRVNSIGTENMLKLAKAKGARFFHTSTSEIYGDPLEHPQKESYFGNVQPYCKRSCYDEGKRYAEALIYVYRNNFDVNTGFIRIFNTYGPYMRPDDGRVISTFIIQALKNEDITVQGTGKQTRSFCYVDDQIEAIYRMIYSDCEGPINVGNPVEFTMLELADLVIKLTRSKSKLVFVPLAPSDPKQRKPDITLAKKLLDWEPQVGLEEGLVKTIAYFEKTADK